MSSQQPPSPAWPSDWNNWARLRDGTYQPPIAIGSPLYVDCQFQCDRGFLPAPDGSAGKCLHCLD